MNEQKDQKIRNTLLDLPIFLFAFSLLGACDRPPSADSLKAWTPVDHHSVDDDKAAAAEESRKARGAARAGGDDTAQLVDLAWRQQCVSCHGPMGRGDGQMGPMVKAPDLTRKEWQSRATDDDIAATIRAGRNKMPKFDLPPAVLQGLVARIRSLQGS